MALGINVIRVVRCGWTRDEARETHIHHTTLNTFLSGYLYDNPDTCMENIFMENDLYLAVYGVLKLLGT